VALVVVAGAVVVLAVSVHQQVQVAAVRRLKLLKASRLELLIPLLLVVAALEAAAFLQKV
jgi:hypothetical protein